MVGKYDIPEEYLNFDAFEEIEADVIFYKKNYQIPGDIRRKMLTFTETMPTESKFIMHCKRELASDNKNYYNPVVMSREGLHEFMRPVWDPVAKAMFMDRWRKLQFEIDSWITTK
ncbi:hypothetical protein TetV_577 [Tetraselmis virus 1]|uniref:Uncharacterized protein n=1 Tax=Tetraselmis virus 1 TaxID=2060617 RepID=A0A2P0VPD3_9VIRU|nr:hypothetical protein QJ968_gp477 [Tetraselmis virus 1]AUF82659.1 hypothetical protein TetV_577 [Tetraselmis virus 1]